MISDEEIDEDDVQVISSVDDQSACSIPFLANHTTPNSSKQIESTTIEFVGHNSAEAGSIEDNVTDIGLVIYGIPQPQNITHRTCSLHCLPFCQYMYMKRVAKL